MPDIQTILAPQNATCDDLATYLPVLGKDDLECRYKLNGAYKFYKGMGSSMVPD